MQPHEASLKNYLKQAFPHVRDIDDVVQESYLRIWKRQATRPITDVAGTVKTSVKAFLFQIARRLALDSIRHNKVAPFVSEAFVDGTAMEVVEDRANATEVACANQEFQLLLQAIATLPRRRREVIVLRKLHGLSPAETAARLSISEETVHVQTRKGLQRVQDYLRARGVIREGRP